MYHCLEPASANGLACGWVDQIVGYKPIGSNQTRINGNCCFSARAALTIKSKSIDWFIQYPDNVSECSAMWTVLQWVSAIKIQLNVLVLCKKAYRHHHFIENNLPWYSWTIVHLALNNNHSLIHYNWLFLYCFN